MKQLFKKYYEMSDRTKDEIEERYILHNLKKSIKNNLDLKLNIQEEEILFETVKYCIKYLDKSCNEIISILLDVIRKDNINIYRLEDLGISELIELLNRDNIVSINTTSSLEMRAAFEVNKSICNLCQKGKSYILVYEDNNCIQYQDEFVNLKDLLSCLIKCKLKERQQEIV